MSERDVGDTLWCDKPSNLVCTDGEAACNMEDAVLAYTSPIEQPLHLLYADKEDPLGLGHHIE